MSGFDINGIKATEHTVYSTSKDYIYRQTFFFTFRPIGDPDPRKVVKIKNPKPKQPVDAPAESGETAAAGAP